VTVYEASIHYRLVFLGPVASGSGNATGRADHGIARENGTPFIPGSQMRGILRHRVEQVAALFGAGVGAVERLFGADGQEPALRFSDLRAAAEEPGCTEVRQRVSISRRTGTQVSGRLFSMEVWRVPQLSGRVDIFHSGNTSTADADLGVVIAALRLVDAVGHARSAGLGSCKVELGEVSVNGSPVDLAGLPA